MAGCIEPRTKISVAAVAAACILSGCAPPALEGDWRPTRKQLALVKRIDAAQAKAAAFLVSKQSPDGAWRSETYGMFRDGVTLTPYVMSALFFMRQGGTETRAAFRRGVECCMKMLDEEGRMRAGPHGFLFPVLTATSASRMVVLETKDEAHLQAQKHFLRIVLERQLTEELGWTPEDPEYGGWGFSLERPRKPRPGQLRERFFESNMVATIFGIGALRSARTPRSDPAWKKTLVFVKRCQNFAEDPARADPRFDDGGFFFIPGDPLQNKAGISGKDRFGRTRFHSYGTMTADGVRALLQCGLPRDHPRVAAARRWLERNFSAAVNPGVFNEDREVLRNATYYYWAWAAAHAFTRLGIREIERGGRKVRWADELAREVLRRQLPDGTWTNRFTDANEDDPLVSVPWGAAALEICRHTILARTPAEVSTFTKPKLPARHPGRREGP